MIWAALVAMGLALGSYPVTEIATQLVIATFGSSYGFQQTLVLAAPLVLTGTAVAVAMRMNIWNVGGEGQFYFGALAAAAVGLFLPHGPSWIMLPLMALAAAAAGALWILIPALGRAYKGISEIITTLLLSFVASYLVAYLGTGPWRDPLVPSEVATERIIYELPAFADGAHLGIPIAVTCSVLIGLFLRYSKWGYETVIAGANRDAAVYAGIPLQRRVIQLMLISGAFAGLAGMIEVTGVVHRLQGGMSNQYGALGIPIAAVADGSITGVIIAAFFFAVLLNMGISLQIYGLSVQSVLGIAGLLLFIIALAEAAARFSLHREPVAHGAGDL
ncbi:MAG: ABC transporter permease [Parvibaculaceae bacterium]